MLTRAAVLTEMTIWGAYFPNNDPVPADSFVVVVRSNNAGTPGPAIHTDTVSAPRLRTGGTLAGVDEYEFVLRLQFPQLVAGTYWVELFHQTGGNTSNFTWRRGNLDGTAGVAGGSSSTTAPGVTWSAIAEDLAYRLSAY